MASDQLLAEALADIGLRRTRCDNVSKIRKQRRANSPRNSGCGSRSAFVGAARPSGAHRTACPRRRAAALVRSGACLATRPAHGRLGAYNLHSAYRLRGRARRRGAPSGAGGGHAHVTTSLRTTFSSDDGRPVIAVTGQLRAHGRRTSPRTERSAGAHRAVGGAPARHRHRTAVRRASVAPRPRSPHPLVAGAPPRLRRLVHEHHRATAVRRPTAATPAGFAPTAGRLRRLRRVGALQGGDAARAPRRSGARPWTACPALRLPADRGTEAGEVSLALSADVSRPRSTTWPRVPAPRRSSCCWRSSPPPSTGTRRRQDLVVCTPVAGRPDPALEDVVGYFNDLVPVRGVLAGDPDLLDARSSATARPCWRHSSMRVPFQWIAGLAETRSTPLTRGLFALNNVPATGLELPRTQRRAGRRCPSTISDFELGWFMRSEGGRYRATVQLPVSVGRDRRTPRRGLRRVRGR